MYSHQHNKKFKKENQPCFAKKFVLFFKRLFPCTSTQHNKKIVITKKVHFQGNFHFLCGFTQARKNIL
jgi:hypothetical protein